VAATRIAYGIQAVRKALATRRVVRVFVQEGVGPRRLGRLADELWRADVAIVDSPPAELRRMTGTDKHQGVAAEVSAAQSLSDREAREFVAALPNALVLALDGVQDPRNFGAILRAADGAGVDLVVVARSRNVAVTPVVSKVAAGAAESQVLAEVANLARFLEQLREDGVTVCGTDEAAPITIFEADLAGPVALVLGAEGEGMRRLTRERCDLLVRLPMHGTVESLNVAVAAGVCLYECVRQRLARGAAVR
jgi:23S rRNA (guanosine2251-2'-O)-methyltransferase